jgi:PD-(D/E)XK nuclease superfamily protein
MTLENVNEYITAGLTHSIHTSERKSFRGCRRRWDWISRQFYYPRVTARPLEFGVAFHAAMEEYYKSYLGLFVNPDPAASLAIALATFKKVTQEQKLKYIKLNDGMPEEMIEDYRDRVELGVAMLNYYFKNVAPRQHKGLKPVKVEIKFEVPIANPYTGEQDLWCKCDWCWHRFKRWAQTNEEWMEGFTTWKGVWDEYRRDDWAGLPVTYGGRIDILLEDSEGNLWIGDWKTASRLSGTETSDEYLWNDDQITAYVWALRLIGIRVAGFIYAEIKKAVPEEPEPLKVVRLGRRFSVSKNLDTNAELYESTVAENDPEAYGRGLYADHIQFLKEFGPQYHRWHQVMRNDHECREAGINIWKEAKEMTDPDLLIYPNAGRFHCKGQGAFSGCAFWDPCLAMNRGEDHVYALETMYDKLDRHYWEDVQPSTDKHLEKV